MRQVDRQKDRSHRRHLAPEALERWVFVGYLHAAHCSAQGLTLDGGVLGSDFLSVRKGFSGWLLVLKWFLWVFCGSE